MKKLTLILMLGMLPTVAFAKRTGWGTCEYETTITTPKGYCCISYYDHDGSYTETFWNCDNLDLSVTTMAECKKSSTDCIQFCYQYDVDNDTCSDTPVIINPCEGEIRTNTALAEDCTIPNATLCSYDKVCDGCGNNCYRENETVDECISDNYYMTTDFKQCLKCPGDGIVDWDMGNEGIATCYISRNPMTGSDATGTFRYVNDKCHYKE